MTKERIDYYREAGEEAPEYFEEENNTKEICVYGKNVEFKVTKYGVYINNQEIEKFIEAALIEAGVERDGQDYVNFRANIDILIRECPSSLRIEAHIKPDKRSDE